MKAFTSFDSFPTRNIWLVRRDDPKAKPAPGELPSSGEEITLDGKRVVVDRADVYGDSECHHWPDIAIRVRVGPQSP